MNLLNTGLKIEIYSYVSKTVAQFYPNTILTSV